MTETPAYPEKPPGRVWFYRPQLPWRGWASWRLWWRSSDEYGRRTLVIGPDVTGSMVIAYKVCECPSCAYARRLEGP